MLRRYPNGLYERRAPPLTLKTPGSLRPDTVHSDICVTSVTSHRLQASETVTDTHADQHRIHLHVADLRTGDQDIAADLHFFHIEVQRPVLVELEIDAGTQCKSDTAVLERGRAAQQVDAGDIGVVDTGTDIRTDL